jgi:hypothetical protein
MVWDGFGLLLTQVESFHCYLLFYQVPPTDEFSKGRGNAPLSLTFYLSFFLSCSRTLAVIYKHGILHIASTSFLSSLLACISLDLTLRLSVCLSVYHSRS